MEWFTCTNRSKTHRQKKEFTIQTHDGREEQAFTKQLCHSFYMNRRNHLRLNIFYRLKKHQDMSLVH